MDSLAAIASFTGSARGQLIGLTAPKVDFNWVTDFSAEAVTHFEEMDGGNPALNYRVAAGLTAMPGQIMHDVHYERAKRGLRDERYLDYCEEVEIQHGCQTIVAYGQSGFVGLAALRTKADGRTGREDLAAFAKVVPHVRSAVELQWAIEGQGESLLLGSFDAIDQAVLFLDSGHRALSHTVAADRLLSGLRTPRLKDRRLSCDHPRDQAALDRAIASVLSGMQMEATVVLSQHGAMPLFVSVHAFSPPETNMSFRPRAILILRSMAQAAHRGDAWLRHAGLTPAEIEIAQALAKGTPRQLIADQRAARIGTVRQQIKTIFAKLGVHREAEFIALLGQQPPR